MSESGLEQLLKSIECPLKYDPSNEKSNFIGLINWLEDRKIRELEINEREQLRLESSEWDKSFNEYLSFLGCPFDWPNSQSDCVFWILSLAVSAEYEDQFSNVVVPDTADLAEEYARIDALGDLFDLKRAENEDPSCSFSL
jgi:hypothetical protein